jgi:hypothetical protein
MPDSDGKRVAGGEQGVRVINEAKINIKILSRLSSRVLPPLIYDLLECPDSWRFFSPMNLG